MSAVVAASRVQERWPKRSRRIVAPVRSSFAPLKSAYGVEQFQFHTPPATSYLRVHQPAKFGDDLASFRKTVVATNAEQKTIVASRAASPGWASAGGADRARRQASRVGGVRPDVRPILLRGVQADAPRRRLLPHRENAVFKTFGGTLADRSFFDQADYGNAGGGAFLCARASSARRRWPPCSSDQGFLRQVDRVAEIVMDNSEYVPRSSRPGCWRSPSPS